MTTQTDSVNSTNFWDFIEGLIIKLRNTNESKDNEDVIIMDGSPIHGANIVKAKLLSLNQLAIVFASI